MNNVERIVKHLEMTQVVMNRMGRNSFQLKGWSMTILVAAKVLIARTDLPSPFLILALIFPIIGFWFLDGYFIRQERLFRHIYDDVRKQSDTNFEMNVAKHKSKSNCKWRAIFFSIVLGTFYGVEVVFTIVVFAVIYCG